MKEANAITDYKIKIEEVEKVGVKEESFCCFIGDENASRELQVKAEDDSEEELERPVAVIVEPIEKQESASINEEKDPLASSCESPPVASVKQEDDLSFPGGESFLAGATREMQMSPESQDEVSDINRSSVFSKCPQPTDDKHAHTTAKTSILPKCFGKRGTNSTTIRIAVAKINTFPEGSVKRKCSTIKSCLIVSRQTHTSKNSHHDTNYKQAIMPKEHTPSTSQDNPYKCTICPKMFMNKSSLNVHMLLHTTRNESIKRNHKSLFRNYLPFQMGTRIGIKIYKCDKCNERFSFKGSLLLHAKKRMCGKNYTISKQFSMQSKMLNKDNLRDKRNKISLVYTECMKNSGMKVHLNSCKMTQTDNKPLDCSICKKGIPQGDPLCTHMYTTRKSFQRPICTRSFNLGSSMILRRRNHTKEKNFQPNICEKNFTRKTNLLRQTGKKTGEKLLQRSHYQVTSQNVTLHGNIRTHTSEKSFQCYSCRKSFNRKDTLLRHILIHTGENRVECSVCKKTYSKKGSLYRHMRIHASIQDKNSFQCSICKRNFKSKYCLNIHMRTHTPFECSICKRNFQFKQCLNVHMLIHTGEKPFQCSICKRNFRIKRTLSDHMLTHTGEKPFQCSICMKSFRQKGTIRDHMRTHTGEKPYQCSMCDKRFSHKGSLHSHTLIHTGKKPFRCHICENSFRKKGTLRKHILIHGDKAFQCSICGRKYAQKSSLRTHTRIHSEDMSSK